MAFIFIDVSFLPFTAASTKEPYFTLASSVPSAGPAQARCLTNEGTTYTVMVGYVFKSVALYEGMGDDQYTR